ncbi:hypothetical protein K3495_g10751 [Podosphaera aphanis]|nr:hypothetical protein K3495_g10751 [Podosphaera aphanis]
MAKVLMDLGKLYGDPENKFGGGFYDVLDSKLRIFYDLCDKVGVTPDLYSVAYSTMLKEKAQDFYYQHLARQNFSFEVMVNKTRAYFHTPENYQAYLMEWRSTMLKSVIEANPEKNMSECLELVIDKLQKVHQGLVHNYNDNHSLSGQSISAFQGVEACSIVLVRPASTFEGVTSDLRSTVGMWMRTHTNLHRTFNSMALEENSDENNQYYVDRRYIGNAHPRGRGGYQSRSFPRGDFQVNNGHSGRQQKKCFVCGKPKCWSTRHTPEERKQRRSDWRSYAQDMEIYEDLEAFLVNYEGIDTEEDLDKDSDSKDFHAWLASTPDKSGSKQFDQFHTACGSINGRITTNLLNNQCVMHALTGTDPYDGKADGPSHLFHFQSRYGSDVFQGIMPDTGAAGISTAGENQVKALQKKLPSIELDTSTAGRYSVRFGDNPDTQSLGTVDVKTPFGMICFAVMPSNTPFLLCLSDTDKYGVYLNNVENVLVHEHKNTP